MAEIDRSLIGTAAAPFVVEVEKGAIRRFAEAIGDPNPLYRDEAFARAQGFPGVVAPPTFPTSFRPPADPPWMIGLDRRRIVAGEVAFAFVRPIVSGMTLECRLRFVGVEAREGRKGSMELIRQEMTGHDGEGLVFTHARTTVYRSLEQVERKSLG